jgi:hypothetical protein
MFIDPTSLAVLARERIARFHEEARRDGQRAQARRAAGNGRPAGERAIAGDAGTCPCACASGSASMAPAAAPAVGRCPTPCPAPSAG